MKLGSLASSKDVEKLLLGVRPEDGGLPLQRSPLHSDGKSRLRKSGVVKLSYVDFKKYHRSHA